jgi:hypothetical protein
MSVVRLCCKYLYVEVHIRKYFEKDVIIRIECIYVYIYIYLYIYIYIHVYIYIIEYTYTGRLNIEAISILCDKDKSVLRDMCTPSNIKDSKYKQLPLHFLIRSKPPRSEVSVEGIHS